MRLPLGFHCRLVFLFAAAMAVVPLFTLAACGSGETNTSTTTTSANTNTNNASRSAGGTSAGSGAPGSRPFGARSDVPPTPVAVAEVRRGSIPRLLRSSGRLHAPHAADISAGLTGQILEVHVEIGDTVRRGDVLATFDMVEFERALDEARLSLQQRDGERRRAELQLEHARTELARAQDDSRPEGYDTMLYTIEQYERLHLNVREGEVALELARYSQRAAELAVQTAERNLALCHVRSPFDAVIASRTVNPFDRIGQGDVLFNLVDIGTLELRIRVTEGEAAAVQPGQAAMIASRGRVPIAYPALVERVAPVVDVEQGVVEIVLRVLPWRSVQSLHLWGQTQQVVRLVSGPVPGHFPTFPFLAAGTTPPLRPGMFVGVEIATAVHPNAVLCPKEGLQFDGDQPYAFVVHERMGGLVAVRTPVRLRTDFATPEAVEVESGLSPGDRVVVRQADLRDGARVEIAETSN